MRRSNPSYKQGDGDGRCSRNRRSRRHVDYVVLNWARCAARGSKTRDGHKNQWKLDATPRHSSLLLANICAVLPNFYCGGGEPGLWAFGSESRISVYGRVLIVSVNEFKFSVT